MDAQDSNPETDLLLPPVLRATDEAEANGDAAPKSEQKPKKDWELTHSALHRLLNWLGGEEKYLEIYRRLVSYFARRNCQSPNDLADKTLNRVARRLEEEGSIAGIAPAKYCYTIARTVFLEYWNGPERKQVDLDEASDPVEDPTKAAAEREEQERLLDCLRSCIRELDPASRELIIQYYHGEKRAKIEHRQELADRLGISIHALRIRAKRIRARLENCISKCAGR